ncbi:hypothetical protein LAZ29_05085 [Cereibacter sphaeroides]|uniref:hypothetical protein n=1 Tax=Cereibacter sphaeroides TaxID=1063 RepID=UPI001F36CFAA|nr:hypothetical protein [Cereibacter sphaeroides]MCE6950291.1 hypothetical protein [Cereibacter sphaeroides]
MLGRQLSRVELVAADLKLKSVLVDPDEVRVRLRDGDGAGRLSVIQAAERLRLEAWAVRELVSKTDEQGRPFLPAVRSRDSAGEIRLYFEPRDVEAFADEHVELKALAAERGVATKALQAELLKRAVRPILPKSSLNKLVYRRADL